jgi:hypothetical protein
VIPFQFEEDGKVPEVHVAPLSALTAVAELSQAAATKTPLPKVATFQFAADGIVLAVHVMPSGLVAALEEV